MAARVFAVVSMAETLCYARDQTASDIVDGTTHLAPTVQSGVLAGRPIRLSDSSYEMGVGAHETVAGDADRERRFQFVRNAFFNDQSRQQVSVLWLRIPFHRERPKRL